MKRRNPIMSEGQVALFSETRDTLVSLRLDHSRRVLEVRSIDEALSTIESRLAAHREALARMAGVRHHG